jgi:hypothetical protein
MRRHCAAMIAVLLMTLAALCGQARAQVGFDRPGADYTSFALRNGDPSQCASRCERDGRCRAWSFSYPTDAGAAMCWLKSRVPPRVAVNCCVSGVKGAGVIEPRAGEAIEFGIDRYGGDLRGIDVPSDPTGKSCAASCEGDAQCRAWTYVRPGYIGPAAMCVLKDRVTAPQRKPCCISGVIR